jgi:hypothetical protein
MFCVHVVGEARGMLAFQGDTSAVPTDLVCILEKVMRRTGTYSPDDHRAENRPMKSEFYLLEETREYRNSSIPEAKNKPLTTAKDMKENALFQHRLSASTTKPPISRIPEIRNVRSITLASV